DILVKRGATSVMALATHGVLSGPALERLNKSVLSKVVITNTLPLPTGDTAKIEVLSVAPLFADSLSAVFDSTSVSKLFGGHNQG
ncbi:MAG TPA: ribose-phosphate diphosphokinase, partial [Candidatus Saccharimonadales bacterium]|nr:ribose-phosphate diphosphokinase [Candidatus Saccharimonadales bacterium]